MSPSEIAAQKELPFKMFHKEGIIFIILKRVQFMLKERKVSPSRNVAQNYSWM